MDAEPDDLLTRLARLAGDLGPALAPAGHHELLRSITAAARHIFEAAACSLALVEAETNELVFQVASGAGAAAVEGMRIPGGEGIAGFVVASGQPLAIEDVEADSRFARPVAERTGYVPRSILAMPLATERGTIGVISVLDRRGDPRDMELLALFAHQAALAIENSRVFSDLGGALLGALAGAAASDADLSAALERAAAGDGRPPGPAEEMAALAAAVHELSLAGPAERQAAAGVLGALATYMRATRGLR